MDPNEALNDLRDGIDAYEASEPGTDAYERAHTTVVSAARALDEWLSRGGFLQTDWERK